MHLNNSFIDNGTGMVKAKFAGEDQPCVVFSSIIIYSIYSNQIIGVNNSKEENAEFQKSYAFSAFVISFLRLICVYSSFNFIRFFPCFYRHRFIIVIVITVFTCFKPGNHYFKVIIIFNKIIIKLLPISSSLTPIFLGNQVI